MKTKKPSCLFFLLCILIISSASGQTLVSGNINSNTIWTKANSPYEVTDTVMVFPGVTLTIEAGVTVKFDSAVVLEMRQATLIAIGTITDSIIFTSNSTNPHLGIWKGIYLISPVGLQTDYCIYKYADNALNISGTNTISLIMQHSSFYFNQICFQNTNNTSFRNCSFYNNTTGIGTVSSNIDSCIFMNNSMGVAYQNGSNVSNCQFVNNSTGISLAAYNSNTVRNSIFCSNTIAIDEGGVPNSRGIILNCNFSKNHIGLNAHYHMAIGNLFTENDTALNLAVAPGDSIYNNFIFHNHFGMLLSATSASGIFNNKICNNAGYNLVYNYAGDLTFSNNCWCDTDSVKISAKIYDGYDNFSLGFIKFNPLIVCDSSLLLTLPPINCQTLVLTNVDEQQGKLAANSILIYPNPTTNKLHIIYNAQAKSQPLTTLYLCDLTGRIVLEKIFSAVVGENKIEMDVTGVAKGVYFLNAGFESGVAQVVIE